MTQVWLDGSSNLLQKQEVEYDLYKEDILLPEEIVKLFQVDIEQVDTEQVDIEQMDTEELDTEQLDTDQLDTEEVDIEQVGIDHDVGMELQ